MAIQGTQVPMYTKHTLFLYFYDFSKFYLFLYEKQNKAKTEKKTHKKIIKTRCTCMRRKEERKRSIHGDDTNVLMKEFKTFAV